MKKTLFLLLLWITCAGTRLHAQHLQAAYSEDFPEYYGSSELKLLKNGNTALFQYYVKDGLLLKLYGADRKTLFSGPVKMPFVSGDAKDYNVVGILALSDQLAIFLRGTSKSTDKKNTLYRVLLDGATGQVKEEKILLQHDKDKAKNYMAATGQTVDDFQVFKDVYSDHYAVSSYNAFIEDVNRRLQVVHYDGSHKELSNGWMAFPSSDYTTLDVRHVLVNADKFLVVIVNAASKPTIDESTVQTRYVGRLDKGAQTFHVKTWAYEMKNLGDYYLWQLDPASDKAHVMVKLYPVGQKPPVFVSTTWYAFDLAKLEAGAAKPLTFPRAGELLKAEGQLSDGAYAGIVQNFTVDAVGNYLWLTETYRKASRGDGYVKSITELDGLALTAGDKAGNDKYAWAIPYPHYADEWNNDFMYQRREEDAGCSPHLFKAGYADLVAGRKFNYVFLNNKQENINRKPGDKPAYLSNYSGMNAYYIRFDNKTGALSKDYIFFAPSGKDSGCTALFNSADYDPATGTYVVVYLENKNGKKHSGVAWLRLE